MSEKTLNQILSELQSMKLAQQETNANLKSFQNETTSELQSLKSSFNEMNTELHSMKSQMNHRFDSIETRLGNIEAKVGTIHSQVVTNTEKLTGLSSSQAKVEKVLTTLSVRSLEQETDIRELKQIK